MSAETMQNLADRYVEGIVTISIVICLVYIALSMLIVIKARRHGLDVCVFAFIPVLNLSTPLRVLSKDHKKRKLKEKALMAAKEEEKSSEEFDENEVIDL